MNQTDDALQKCQEICEQYSPSFEGTTDNTLYDTFIDECICLQYFLAISDGIMDKAELTTLNVTHNVLLTPETYEKIYGSDFLSEESILRKVPKSLQQVAVAEKRRYKNRKCFLCDTRILYQAMKTAGQNMINCNASRLRYQVMLLNHFCNNVVDYLFGLEEQDDSGDELLEGRSFSEIKEDLKTGNQTLFQKNLIDNKEEVDEILNNVDALIGLSGVKKDVHDLVNLLIVQQMRQRQGLKGLNTSRHLVFTGNPGTGKTTIARLLAKVYHSLGILQTGQLIETDRSGLVAGYMGQTAGKVTEVVNSAMGGILFIDEAYTLINGQEGDYGKEAVDTLLKLMEDHRDELIVIIAGYPKPIEKFLDSNPGLRSRFNKYIRFEDYSSQELTEIFKSYCTEQDYHLAPSLEKKLCAKIELLKKEDPETFGNARTVRNYFEDVVSRQANRIVSDRSVGLNASAEILMQITEKDL